MRELKFAGKYEVSELLLKSIVIAVTSEEIPQGSVPLRESPLSANVLIPATP